MSKKISQSSLPNYVSVIFGYMEVKHRNDVCFWCILHYLGEQGMVDEAQKALEEAEALKKVLTLFIIFQHVDYIYHHVCVVLGHCLMSSDYIVPLSI